MADEDSKQVDLEVSLKDTSSNVLKDIARQIDLISRKMLETGKTGSDAFDKIAASGKRASENTKSTGESFLGMSGALASVAKTMVGPVGLVAAAIAATKAIGNFAAQRVQLQALQTDLGFTTEQIGVLDRMLRGRGMQDEGERKSLISQMGATYKEFETFGTASQFAGRLAQFGDSNLTAQMFQARRERDPKAFWDAGAAKFEQLMKQGNIARADYFARTVMGVAPSLLTNYLKEQAATPSRRELPYTESAEFLRKREAVINAFYDTVNRATDATITNLLKLDTGFAKFAAKHFTIPRDKSGNIDTSLLAGSAGGGMGGVYVAPETQAPEDKPKPEPRALGGPVKPGRSYLVGERGPELFSPTSSGAISPDSQRTEMALREMNDSEKESNKSLKEIRDILKQMDDDATIARAPGGGGTTFRPGIRTGGGVGSSGSDAGPGGLGTTAPWRGGGGGGTVPTSGSSGGTVPTSGVDSSGTDVGPGGSAMPRSPTLANMRARFRTEIESDPRLKDILIDAAKHEGGERGIKSNLEQIMNYALLHHMTIKQALYSGQYGPMTGSNRDPNMGNINAKLRARGEATLKDVFAGSNIIDYTTDQGIVYGPHPDPSAALYKGDPKYWNLHQVEGASFAYHHEQGRRFAMALRKADEVERQKAAVAAEATKERTRELLRGHGAARVGPTPEALARQQVDKAAAAFSVKAATVNATVDFGAMAKAQETTSPVFLSLKPSSTRQNSSVREGTVVAGDPSHSIWTP